MFFTETQAALVLAVAGCICFSGFFISRERKIAMYSTSAIPAAVEGFVAAAFALGNPIGTGSGTYALFMFLGCWLLWRTSS